jgi:hypothetical protein
VLKRRDKGIEESDKGKSEGIQTRGRATTYDDTQRKHHDYHE